MKTLTEQEKARLLDQIPPALGAVLLDPEAAMYNRREEKVPAPWGAEAQVAVCAVYAAAWEAGVQVHTVCAPPVPGKRAGGAPTGRHLAAALLRRNLPQANLNRFVRSVFARRYGGIEWTRGHDGTARGLVEWRAAVASAERQMMRLLGDLFGWEVMPLGRVTEGVTEGVAGKEVAA